MVIEFSEEMRSLLYHSPSSIRPI